MAIEALEGLTDEQLFNEANSDDAPAEEVVAEPAEEIEEQPEQARDEAGRFAGKPENEPEAPAATDPPARAPVDDNAAMVPSWRVREINEEKRALAERVAAFEAEKLQWQRQPQAQPAKEPEKVAKPDPLLDPDAYEAYIEQKVEAKLLNDRRESSLKLAHRTYKAEFEEAYAAAQKQIDPVLRARMHSADDPGETLIQWHREQKTRAEVGTDLTAYKQRLREEALKDPEFRKQAMEAWRSDAQQQPGGRPATSLPPSLTRATNAASLTSADDEDVSDDGLWRHANA